MAVLPILLLLLGAIAVLATRRGKERLGWSIATGAALAAWVSALGLVGSLPASIDLSVWRPADLFASRIELLLDPTGWQFVYGAATLLVAVLLTGADRLGEATPQARALMLAFTALAVLAMLAGNLLTLATVWALMDAVLFIFLVGVVREGEAIQGLVARASVDVAAVLLVVGAALADRAEGGASDLAEPLHSALAAGLLALAVLLRLGLLPPHFSLPPLPNVRRGLGTLLRLLPPAAALCVLARALGDEVPASLLPWLRFAGGFGLMIGGIRWVFEPEPVRGRRFLVLGLSGLGVLAAGVTGVHPDDVIAAAGSLVLFAGALTSLAAIHTPGHRLWPLLAGLLVAGLPGTPGGQLAQGLMAGVSESGQWLAGLVALIGMACLALGAMRGALATATPWAAGESLVRVVYGIGLALPFVACLGLGIWTQGSLGTQGLVLFAAVMATAVGMAVVARQVAPRSADRWKRLVPMLDPMPIYRLLWRGLAQMAQAVRLIGDVLEGEGAMLWTYVILLLIILAVR